MIDLPDPPAAFQTGSATHVGKVRSHNEDSYAAHPNAGIWAVADGMGGHEAGDVASATVAAALGQVGPQPSAHALLQATEAQLAQANAAIRRIAEERGADVIGTTVVTLLARETWFACVWSGDSRAYLVRNGGIAQISRDHTEVQELVSRGMLTPEEARIWPGRNIITRAIGASEQPELESIEGTLVNGDIFVLCSDGLTAHVDDAEILGRVKGRLPQEACNDLLQLTLERGASDNVTILIVRYKPENTVTFLMPGGSAPQQLWD